MKIKSTEIKIIQGNISALKADVIIQEQAGKSKNVIMTNTRDKKGKSDQTTIRRAVAEGLKKAHGLKVKSLAMTGIGGEDGQFPVVGAAKIIIQEIIKYLRTHDTSLREIVICLSDVKIFAEFKKTIEGYVRHLQDDLGWGPYVTVDIIIELKEGIILIERSNPPYGWALPGGFVDYGESLEHAAVREAKEETNVDLENLKQFHTYSDPNRDPRFPTISTVFIGRGQGKPQFGDDAKGLKIVPYKELLKLDYAFDHKKIIQDYLKAKSKSL